MWWRVDRVARPGYFVALFGCRVQSSLQLREHKLTGQSFHSLPFRCTRERSAHHLWSRAMCVWDTSCVLTVLTKSCSEVVVCLLSLFVTQHRNKVHNSSLIYHHERDQSHLFRESSSSPSRCRVSRNWWVWCGVAARRGVGGFRGKISAHLCTMGRATRGYFFLEEGPRLTEGKKKQKLGALAGLSFLPVAPPPYIFRPQSAPTHTQKNTWPFPTSPPPRTLSRQQFERRGQVLTRRNITEQRGRHREQVRLGTAQRGSRPQPRVLS